MLAILVAASISMLAERQRKAIVSVFEVMSRIVFGVIRLIMWLAPLGAFGGMAYTVAVFGADSLTSLGALMAVFWGTCAFFVIVVLGTVARVSGFSIFRLIRLIRDELLIIVGTSSSETVLPRLLAKTQAAGASKQVSGMVLPTGYSFNLDGTCIYLTLGALFIVQASGQDMSIGEQIALAGLMVLTSKGAAGITGAGLVTLTASLQAFGGTFFSAESIAVGIALVVGIDRIMSEGRALTNAIGNTVATMVVAKWQGELDEERFQRVLHDPTSVDAEVERAMIGADERRGASGPAASSATASWWCLRGDVQRGAVERVQRALDGHRHARERGRVALGVGRSPRSCAGAGRGRGRPPARRPRRRPRTPGRRGRRSSSC